MNTTSGITRARRMDVRRPARHQVIGLAAQFLLGMAISLIGQPSETTGTAHTAGNVLLGLHVLVAVVLIAGAAGVIRAARGGSDRQRRLARCGAAAIVLTFGAGITTLITKNDWWSYAMAVGFIVSLLIYVSLLVQATSDPP
jgi:heme A synthase